MFNKLLLIREELRSFSKQEKFFIINVMVCAFLICADYAIIRPVSISLFTSAYSAAIFPYAWLGVAPLSFGVIVLYNRYLGKMGYFRMFAMIILIAMGINLLFALFLNKVFSLPFFLYIWKEVYVMLALQQLWSMIHSTIPSQKAKYLYGIIFGMGGLGGMLGSALPGFLAVNMGSEALVFFTVPIYALLLIFFSFAAKNGKVKEENSLEKKIQSIGHSIQLISRSRILRFILLAVLFMQLSSTLVEYQFNTLLEVEIPTKDLRTQYCGRMFAIVNFVTMTLQFVGTFFIVHFLGLRGSHLFVPSLLGMNVVGFLVFPVFSMISSVYIAMKSLDFSLFGVIREMLYVPLKQEEKFHAKAFIDVFVYRFPKTFISPFFILAQPFFSSLKVVSLVTWITLGIFLFWMITITRMLKGEEFSSARRKKSITQAAE